MNLRQLLRKPFVSNAFATPVDLAGRHMIVTGCGLGSLGYETALQLASWGATIQSKNQGYLLYFSAKLIFLTY